MSKKNVPVEIETTVEHDTSVNVLVVGDVHLNKDIPLERVEVKAAVIAREAVLRKPEYVILIGDVLDMECFSFWKKSKPRLMEGDRYKAEIERGNLFLDTIENIFKEYNRKGKKAKTNHYNPTIVYIGGNHDHQRIEFYLDANPQLENTISLEGDLKLAKRGVLFVPYKGYFTLNKVGFTHIPHGGNFRPIRSSGVSTSIAAKALADRANSVVFGHTHYVSFEQRNKLGHDTGTISALCVGNYADAEGVGDYGEGVPHPEWNGLVHMTLYKDGSFDYDLTSTHSLEIKHQQVIVAKYGKEYNEHFTGINECLL